MFFIFFTALRRQKVPVSPTEWLLLMRGLSQGLIPPSLERFYTLARTLLVKDVSYAYDLAFQEAFRGIETPAEILEPIPIGRWQPVTEPFHEPIGIGS